jgi:transposase InsO family protein
VKYERIEQHRAIYPTRVMCSALKVSTRGFYSWRHRAESPRRRADRRLLAEIRASYERSHRTYGSPRVLRDLQELGYRCSTKRIARIMRENSLVAVQRRRWKATTQSAHSFPIQINLLAREFKAPAPNRVWLADITYIATEDGWLYLAALMDLFSRKIVGWRTSDRLDRSAALTALDHALRTRAPRPGLIHHSDQGSQYASYEYQRRLEIAKAQSSMSRRGDCYDNAPMESFFSTLKRERVYRRRYWSRDEATADIADYIDGFYNLRRRHSELGGVSPVQFEASAKLT